MGGYGRAGAGRRLREWSTRRSSRPSGGRPPTCRPAARRIPLAALLRRVAGRESADVDEAGLVDVVFKHVQAVFATLAEAVDAEEWFGMIAELPAEYSGLIPERSA